MLQTVVNSSANLAFSETITKQIFRSKLTCKFSHYKEHKHFQYFVTFVQDLFKIEEGMNYLFTVFVSKVLRFLHPNRATTDLRECRLRPADE